MDRFRVASVQFQHAPGNKAANLATIESFARAAVARGVELVAFPEMCISGYWHVRKLSRAEIEELAEPVPDGPSTERLVGVATELAISVGAGLVERGADGELYNTWVLAMPDGRVERHRKIHCFISEHMASGREFTVFNLPNGWRAGVLTCYDNNIGENVRMNALAGAEILLAPHQTGGCDSRDIHIMGKVDAELWARRKEDPEAIEAELRGEKGRAWLLRWLPTRAHDNGLFLVFTNGVGPDGDEIRTGNAMVIDPYGRILAETWKAGDDMVVADLDRSLIANSTGRRWIRTRRPELYGPLAVSTGEEQDTRSLRFDGKGA